MVSVHHPQLRITVRANSINRSVDSVARLLFRSTRGAHTESLAPVFTNSSSARKRLQQFSFRANAFMHSLSTYITDSAIGANHAAFIERLTKLRYGVQEHAPAPEYRDVPDADNDGMDSEADEHSAPLSDVFSIMEYHSAVMDRILEACFLKMRHRGVGGTSLVECMDTILRVGKLVMDLRNARLTDEAAVERKLVKLIERFEICMSNLVRLAPVSYNRGV